MFRLVSPGTNDDVLGHEVEESNAYISLWGVRLNGEKPVANLEVGEGSLHRYAMSGQKPTVYKIVRVDDEPQGLYAVQLPWPYADVEGEWCDRREGPFPLNPEGLAQARQLAVELMGPGQLWPSVRIVKRVGKIEEETVQTVVR